MARILIVDDAVVMRKIMRRMLEKSGHQVVGDAVNGIEGLAKYEELKPDLVTMDIQMAGGDGLTYLQEIIRFDPAAKVVMVSAQGQGAKQQEALSYGAAGFLAKPFGSEELRAEIGNVLDR